MSGYRQRIHEPRLLIYKPRRYTVHELYNLRHRLHFLSCPLEKFSPEAFQYFIVTPHIPASADIEPRIRQQILQTLVKLDEERMATTSIPPHLRKLAAGKASNLGPTTNSVVSEPITPLTVVYGNVVGNETLKEPEMPQTVDVDMADAWWAQLTVNQKVEIAEPYILEGQELPSPKVTASSAAVASSTGGCSPSVPKTNLNPTVSSFKMSALKEVVPNVPVGAKKQDEWTASPAMANQDDWGSSPAPSKQNSWGTQSIQPKQGDRSIPSASAQKDPPTLTKQVEWDAPAIPTHDDWITSFSQGKQDKVNVPAIPKKEVPVTTDSWDDPSPSTKQPQLISIEPSPLKTETVIRTTGAGGTEDEDRLIPPHKPGWIGMRSNAAEQEEFIKFMTAKVFPRIIPKKPVLDTSYATENPPPAPVEAGDWATGTGNAGSDW